MTAEQRQLILRTLKKGPQFGDRQALGDFARKVYEGVTKKSLKKAVDKHMKQWREWKHGRASYNETFIH